MISGIDISHYQGIVDFNAVKAAGYSFVFAKATQGTGYVDPQFAANRANAHAAGLTFGMYHFADGGDPAAEAAHFCQTVGSLQVGELVALDWEVAGDAPAFALPWLNAVQSALDVVGGVYLNNTYLTSFDWSAVQAANYWLWYARYDGTANDAPGSWLCAFKQYSSSGAVPGIVGPVDVDVFYGDIGQLGKYGKQDPVNQVVGEIAVKYWTTPGLATLLGAPTTPELGCPDGVGRYNHFTNDNGSIYWIAPYGAFSIHGGIAAKWAQMGWERSSLGYPVSDEFGYDTYDRAGNPVTYRQSNFERGFIRWTVTGGAEVFSQGTVTQP